MRRAFPLLIIRHETSGHWIVVPCKACALFESVDLFVMLLNETNDFPVCFAPNNHFSLSSNAANETSPAKLLASLSNRFAEGVSNETGVVVYQAVNVWASLWDLTRARMHSS